MPPFQRTCIQCAEAKIEESSMHLIGVCLMGVYLMGVYLTGDTL
jgi:hypothetical protein